MTGSSRRTWFLLQLLVACVFLVGALASTQPAFAACEKGQTECGGQCVDTSSNFYNCGACGATCDRAQACERGTCKTACPDHQLVCGDTCVTPTIDPRHCGGCGQRCADDAYCSSGTCKPIGAAASTCPTGQRTCGGKCRDTAVDWQHCGACGKTCGVGQTCKDGVCLGTCPKLPLPTEPGTTPPPKPAAPATPGPRG